jgi:hypothetical protein
MQRKSFNEQTTCVCLTSSHDFTAIRMQIRYVPPDALPPAPNSSQKTLPGMVKSEESKHLSFSSPGDKSPLKVGGVGICFRIGPRGEHVVDYLIQVH